MMSGGASDPGITVSPFGTLPDGRGVDLYTLTNNNGMQVSITTFGGIITSLTAPDQGGRMADVVLGFGSLDGYLAEHPYFGAIIGRFANRIGAGRFTLDGRLYRLDRNNDGNHLHGGHEGFDKALWKARPHSTENGPELELTYLSADGEGGYPGRLETVVTYSLSHDNALHIDYRATTDQPTHVNLTSHSYFNLAGHGAGNILQHVMSINADRFTPVGDGLLPTGEMRRVAGTPMDFRTPHVIGDRIDDEDEQLRFGGGYDHNWVLNTGRSRLTCAARVVEPCSGRVLEVHTTEPGIQLYTGNFLEAKMIGKGGRTYGRRSAFCLETQHFPDSPNRPEFPTTILRPGDVYDTTTVYRFLVEAAATQKHETP